MTGVGLNNYNTNLKMVQPQNVPSQSNEEKAVSIPLPTENKQVVISDEGRALLASKNEAELGTPHEKGVTEKVESFTHGVLGMDHPDVIKEKADEDDSYSAGQYLKGALTVGAFLLAIV
jgi:hypothetical protein